MPDTPWSVPEKDAAHAVRTMTADEQRIDRDIAHGYSEVCHIGRRVRICTHTILHTPGKLPNVAALKVELPSADPKVSAKVRAHLWCVFLGGLLAVLLSFAGGALLHIAPFVSVGPNVVLESLDRINNR